MASDNFGFVRFDEDAEELEGYLDFGSLPEDVDEDDYFQQDIGDVIDEDPTKELEPDITGETNDPQHDVGEIGEVA